MAFTRDQAFAAFASLNPAAVFLDSYRSQSLPENLDIFFGPPEEFFIAVDSQELYTRNRLVPILDDGNFDLVTFLDTDSKELVQIDVETPNEVRACFRHWQQYLAELMMVIGEVVEDEVRIRRIADLVGFAHTHELFEYYARTEGLSGSESREARHQFPLGIRV